MSKIKLVLSDVDGTLLTSKKELTPAAKKAIEDLKKAGIGFAVTSGRPPRGMLKFLSELKLEVPLAAFNGGMFFDPSRLPNVEVISEKILPVDVVQAIIERLDQDGHDVWVYRKQDWFVRNINAPHVEKEKNTVAFSPIAVSNFDGLFDQVVKIVGVSDKTDQLSKTGKQLEEEFQGRASSSLSQPYYLDVTHPEANKGAVVRFLSQHLQIPQEAIATLGDMPNDISMFKVSGLSIAMGNSDGLVKSSAVEVTDSDDNEGFAHAIQKLLQKQASC
jgi:Cof subfamily protein (haloacid dehalogenase superfamily)